MYKPDINESSKENLLAENINLKKILELQKEENDNLKKILKSEKEDADKLAKVLDEIKIYCLKNLRNLDRRKDSIYIQGKIDAFIEIYNIIKGNNS